MLEGLSSFGGYLRQTGLVSGGITSQAIFNQTEGYSFILVGGWGCIVTYKGTSPGGVQLEDYPLHVAIKAAYGKCNEIQVSHG